MPIKEGYKRFDMSRIPETSTTLLEELAADSQHTRLGEIAGRYRPMLKAFMHEHFPMVDADEIMLSV